MRATLRLRREPLADLSPADLEQVAGAGTHPPFACTLTCYDCFSFEQCNVPTLPLWYCRINGGQEGEA